MLADRLGGGDRNEYYPHRGTGRCVVPTLPLPLIKEMGIVNRVDGIGRDRLYRKIDHLAVTDAGITMGAAS